MFNFFASCASDEIAMPSATITPRLIYKEDLALSTIPGQTETVTVAGLGAVPLTKIDAILLSSLVSAVSDGGAASAGVGLGDVYYCSATGKLRARMA